MKKRLKKQFCKRGHEIAIVGRDKQRRCNECKKIYSRIDPSKDSRITRFCSKGHDTFIVGRHKNHHCKLCIEIGAKIWAKTHKNKIYERIRQWQQKQGLSFKKRIIFLVKKWKVKNRGLVALHRVKNKAKRALRIPSWGQRGIKQFYIDCPNRRVVDHIIPLCGRKVSGLHVSWNLQYLTQKQNTKKGNSFDGTLENDGWRNRK
jgi:hypothetical protein